MLQVSFSTADMSTIDQLLIVGASCRAAACSARRAGFQPRAADLFADVDLAEVCQATRVTDYPREFLEVAGAGPRCPWLYTGALENYPRLVDQLSEIRPLLGNPGRVLREVRRPWKLARAFARHGVPFPNVARSMREIACEIYLRKPLRSSGGQGIRFVSSDEAAGEGRVPGSYVQQFVEGKPASAVYVARGSSALLGVTEQLVGSDWCGADGFRYAGSIGPLTLDERQRSCFQQIGLCLAREFGLVGLFGVDAVIAADTVWPVEVNPRYPASVEILERAGMASAVGLHVDACRNGQTSDPSGGPSIHGKAIVYARADVTVSHGFADWARRKNANRSAPAVADIPQAGMTIRRRQPVTTVFADGSSLSDVRARLMDSVREVFGVLDA